jgi:hypothetical protein
LWHEGYIVGKKPLKVNLLSGIKTLIKKNEIVRKLTGPNPAVYEEFTENVIFEEVAKIPG